MYFIYSISIIVSNICAKIKTFARLNYELRTANPNQSFLRSLMIFSAMFLGTSA